MKQIFNKKTFLILAPFLTFVFLVFIFVFLKSEKININTPPTLPLSDENVEVGGVALINSNRDDGCFTLDEVPKDNEYISYKYDGKCYINTLYSQKALAIQNLLHKNYESLWK